MTTPHRYMCSYIPKCMWHFCGRKKVCLLKIVVIFQSELLTPEGYHKYPIQEINENHSKGRDIDGNSFCWFPLLIIATQIEKSLGI